MGAKRHLYWIDWLKVLAVLGVFYYHSAMIFVQAPWMIANPTRSLVLTVFAGFGFLFGIPLLFLLSGAASSFALRSERPLEFIRLRFNRLVLPLVAGLLLLSPLQAYFVAASKGYHGSLVDFVPEFFRGIQVFWNPRWFGSYGYHLWYLAFLFLFSVVALPLLIALGRPVGKRFLARLAKISARPGGLLVFVLPLAAVQLSLRAAFPWYQDWADFFYLLVYFVVGFALLSEPRFEAIIRKRAVSNLLLVMLVAAPFMLLAGPAQIMQWELHSSYSGGNLFYLVVKTALVWSWIVTLLSLGIRALDFRNRFLDYASEAVMPFYVLHHPAVVLVGYYVIQWNTGLWIKHILITAVSLALTVSVYEFGVRRVPVMRAIFGMKPLPKSHTVPAAPVRSQLRQGATP